MNWVTHTRIKTAIEAGSADQATKPLPPEGTRRKEPCYYVAPFPMQSWEKLAAGDETGEKDAGERI